MSDRKSFHHFLVSAFAALGLLAAGPALAVTVSPTGSWDAEGFMRVELFGLFSENCKVEVEGTVQANGEGKITNLDFSDGSDPQICNAVGVNNLPYDAEFTDTDTLVIYDVDVDTSLGNCSGDLVGDWDNGDSEILYDDAPLNGPFGSTCLVDSVAGPNDDTPEGIPTDPALDVQP